MNRIQFDGSACEKVRGYLDSYIGNQLSVETSGEMRRHIENCPACAAEMDTRTQLRIRLKAAVNAEDIPAELPIRIREQIRNRRASSSPPAGWNRWAVVMAATAASLVVCVGVWFNYSRQKMPALSDRRGQDAYIQNVSSSLAAVLKVGLRDHVHCSVFRKYPQNPPPVEQMEEKLGPSYKGLLPVVRAAVPEGYRIVLAHQCGYAGRKYIHLTLEKNGDLLSLVIARKNPGESMDGLAAAAAPSGIPVYQSVAGRYQVAGFDAGGFLAYVVSDLKGKANLQIAENLAPGVHEFLMKTPS
jgi:anti-sigma factor RsiW